VFCWLDDGVRDDEEGNDFTMKEREEEDDDEHPDIVEVTEYVSDSLLGFVGGKTAFL
jgi:hypothetical protein